MSYSTFAKVLMAVMMIGGAPLRCAAGGAVAGDERSWTLDFRTRLEQGSGGRPVEIGIRGEWISTVSAVRTGEYDAVLRIANPRVGNEDLERRLQRPFWVTYRNDGVLLAVHFYKDMDPADRNLLLMIATECQMVHGAGASWTTRERDGAGEYLADYQRVGPNAVTKHKVKYVRADGTPGKAAGVHIDIEESESRFTFDAGGEVLSLDARIRAGIGVANGSGNQLTATTETHLAGLRKGQAAAMIGSLERARGAVESSPVRTQQPDPGQLRAQLDKQLLEGQSMESLLAAGMGKSEPEDQKLADRLAALFRQRGDAPARAAEMLRTSGPQRRITDALGAAGSPAAIAVLSSLANDRTLPRPLRIDALTAFMLMREPSVEGMRAPGALFDDADADIASAARIAGGAMAHAGRAIHRDAAEMIDAAFAERYRKAVDTEEIGGLLAAMGNSGGKSLTPVIEGAAHDSRDMVRAAAVRALRLIGGPEVDGVLCSAMVSDRDARVRTAAIFAARFRNPLSSKLGEALVHAAKMDPAEQVRANAVSLLRQHPGVVPQVAETLGWIAVHDPKEGVRRLAQESLKGL